MASREDLNGEIATAVRAATEVAGLTHRDLADATGIPDRTLARLLAGQSDWKVPDLLRIEVLLGLTVGQLLPAEVA